MKLLPPLCPEPISARRGGAIQGAVRSYTGGGAELYMGRGGAIQGAGRVQENSLSCHIYVNVNAP